MSTKFYFSLTPILALSFVAFLCNSALYAQIKADTVLINWQNTVSISKTTPTLQLVENPMVRKNSPIHESTFKTLKDLGADYVRYVPWFPYAKMAVAELKAPTKDNTFWDFTYLDSTMEAFMEATKGHPVVINFSTTPAWMWKTEKEVKYPEDPYQVFWAYNSGTQLRDTTMREVAGYFGRLLSWYTKGGFTDELGKFHKSGHFYKIPYWEVLNEPDLEHNISPQLYTRMYDAIAIELKKVAPATKLVGISLAHVNSPEYFEYFLNLKNHKPGISLDAISYHHYSTPSISNQPIESFQYTAFEKTEAFLEKVRFIENIKKRLSPNTLSMINEVGIILRAPMEQGPIPNEYWNLAGAMFADMFVELTKIGVDVVGESQLVGYPTQFPDVSMMNWENGNPNARYWVLKMLKDNFGPGDKLVTTSYTGRGSIGQGAPVSAQGIITKKGKRILLINKLNKEAQIVLPAETTNGLIHYVDIVTRESQPAQAPVTNNFIVLKPFSVAIVELK